MSDDPTRARPALRPFDFVFILRPSALVPLWVFFGHAARIAGRGASSPGFTLLPSRDAVLGLFAMTAILAGGYVLNQIRDIETDSLNEKLFFLPRGIISVRVAAIEMTVLWGAAIAVTLVLPGRFWWWAAAALLMNITYSLPPVSAKSRFPLDLIWNGVGFGLVGAGAGWAVTSDPTGVTWLLAASYSLLAGGIIASATVLDVDGDRAQGMRTAATVLGVRRAGLTAIIALVVAAILGGIGRDAVGFAVPLLSLPLLVRAQRTGDRSHRIMAGEFAVGVLALVAGVRAPYLLVLLAMVYFGSRAYYRARFGFAYPGPGAR